jgi:hypothetical protein
VFLQDACCEVPSDWLDQGESDFYVPTVKDGFMREMVIHEQAYTQSSATRSRSKRPQRSIYYHFFKFLNAEVSTAVLRSALLRGAANPDDRDADDTVEGFLRSQLDQHRNDDLLKTDFDFYCGPHAETMKNAPCVLPSSRPTPLPAPSMHAAPPAACVPAKARKKVRWTPEEEEAFARLVKMEGQGNWAKVLSEGHATDVIHECRTAVDLKDKWRNMQKKPATLTAVQAAAPTAKPPSPPPPAASPAAAPSPSESELQPLPVPPPASRLAQPVSVPSAAQPHPKTVKKLRYWQPCAACNNMRNVPKSVHDEVRTQVAHIAQPKPFYAFLKPSVGSPWEGTAGAHAVCVCLILLLGGEGAQILASGGTRSWTCDMAAAWRDVSILLSRFECCVQFYIMIMTLVLRK